MKNKAQEINICSHDKVGFGLLATFLRSKDLNNQYPEETYYRLSEKAFQEMEDPNRTWAPRLVTVRMEGEVVAFTEQEIREHGLVECWCEWALTHKMRRDL